MKTPPPFVLLAALSASCAAPSPPAIPPFTPPPAAPAMAAATPPAPAKEPPGPVDALRDKVLATSRAWETVRSLVDEVGPRPAGSPGAKAAVAWGLRTLQAKGLSNVRAEAVKAPHWERGAASGAIVSPYPQELVLAAIGGSVGTPAKGIEADVVEVASLEALEKLSPAAVKGKIVFFYTVMERTRTGEGYGKAVSVRGAGATAAAKLGAAGVLIRSIGTDQSRAPHTGAMRFDAKMTVPAAALAIPDADSLHRVIAEGKPVRVRMSLGSKWMPDVDDANVVGEVPGREAPEEIVLLGAHLDSWDLGRGALDDGAGCGIVIEAASQIAALPRKPRRTVRVVLFANEEHGLAGAKGYARQHEDELARHVVALEADLGAGRVYAASFLGPPGARGAFESIVKHLAPFGVAITSLHAHGGADLSPLQPFGVPLIDLHQDATLYFDVHHTANDTMERVPKDDLDQAAAAFTAVAFAAAEMERDLGRVPEALRGLTR